MRSDRIRQFSRIFNLTKRNKDFRRYLLVQLDVLLELRDDRTAKCLEVLAVFDDVFDKLGFGLKEFFLVRIPDNLRALASLNQNFNGPVGKLQQLQYSADRAHFVDIVDSRIVLTGIFLRDEQDLLVVLHDIFEGFYGFIPADE